MGNLKNLFYAAILLIGAFLVLQFYKKERDPSKDAEQLLQTKQRHAIQSDTVKIELVNNLPYIMASVNGSGVLPFIIATGYAWCVYDAELAQLQNIESFVRQKNDTTSLKLGKLRSLRIGSTEVEDISVELNNLDWTRDHLGKYAAGFIGYEFLKNFEVVFDFPKSVLSMVPSDSIPYELENSDSLCVLPFNRQDALEGQIFIEGVVNEQPMLLAMDTFMPDGLILEGTPDRYRPGVIFGGFEETTRHGRMHSIQRGTIAQLQLGTVRVENVPTQFSCIVEPEPNLPYSNIVGMGVLKQLKITLNYPKQQLVIEKS